MRAYLEKSWNFAKKKKKSKILEKLNESQGNVLLKVVKGSQISHTVVIT